MSDACPHRLAPLSRGAYRAKDKMLAARIPEIHQIHCCATRSRFGLQVSRCAYHGWEFDSGGGCTKIPQVEDGFFLLELFFLTWMLKLSLQSLEDFWKGVLHWGLRLIIFLINFEVEHGTASQLQKLQQKRCGRVTFTGCLAWISVLSVLLCQLGGVR